MEEVTFNWGKKKEESLREEEHVKVSSKLKEGRRYAIFGV